MQLQCAVADVHGSVLPDAVGLHNMNHCVTPGSDMQHHHPLQTNSEDAPAIEHLALNTSATDTSLVYT